jgi:uncharacterized repeat protein (TIGR02543 family)
MKLRNKSANRPVNFILLITILIILYLASGIRAYAQGLVINEVMSSNNSTLVDEDGDYSDWIEIYNPGGSPVNLSGYGLTDHTEDPYMWVFPDITIDAGGYMVVFASDKNRRDIPANYNTIINWGDQWKYRYENSQPPADWNELGFNETGWYTGPSGFGYGDDDDATVIENARTVYLRKTFNITDASALTSAILHMDYDDGFVAYINGTEIARMAIGEPGTPTYWEMWTDYDHEARIWQGGNPERFDINLGGSLLQDGTNVVAIEVHNVSETSSDFTAIPFLTVGGPGISGGYVPEILDIVQETYLHTNFRIKSKGDTIILTTPGGTTLDELFTGTIPADISMGRKPDASGSWYYFDEPTPGQSNTTYGYSGITSDMPVLSHQGGLYSNAFNLVMTSSSWNDTIYYTLDGTIPDKSSNRYTGPIHISGTTILRARLVRNNEMSSSVLSCAYIFIGRDCKLPVISVFSDPYNLWDVNFGIYATGNNASTEFPYFGANFWEDWERPAHIELCEPDGSLDFSVDAGIKIFGGWSRGNPQKSLSVFARKQYGYPEIEYRVFNEKPISKFEALVFRNSGNDWMSTMFRDGMMTSLVRPLGIDVQAFRPAILFLNGSYWGIHNIREKVNEHFIASNHNIDPDSVDLLENSGNVIVGDGQHYYDMIDFVTNNSLANTANYEYIKTQMDVDNFIKYQFSQIYFNNRDWPGNNIKFWCEANNKGKWRWIMFDTDFGFNIGSSTDQYLNTLSFALEANGPGWPNPPWSTLLFRKLVQNQQFRNSFINQFADHLNTTFQPGAVIAHINSIIDKIYPEITYHYDQWGEPIGNWEDDVDRMKTFARERVGACRDHILQQWSLTGSRSITVNTTPELSGQIKVNTIYPPHYPWSGIYFTDVPIELKAVPKEGYRFIGWTGDIDSDEPLISVNPSANYSFTAQFEKDFSTLNPVIINEINYNSHPSFDSEDWVELYNRGDLSEDISGWIFKDSEDAHMYVIPANTVLSPGDFVVLSRDIIAFATQYPSITRIKGNFNFGLSSGGECIRLYNGSGRLEDSVCYGVSAPWPSEPCGHGPTLELIDPYLDNTLPESWTASASHGTPGVVNGAYTSIPEIRASEIYAGNQVNVYPNPFNTIADIYVNMSPNEKARISIYNINGELKQILTCHGAFEGIHKISWDGTDFYGNSLPDGLYLIRIETSKYQTSRKVLLLK